MDIAGPTGLCNYNDMRVYLDNCAFNRPFDNQDQMRIRLEAEAKLCLQHHIKEGALELAWSYILDYENSKNPFEERKQTIAEWRSISRYDIIETLEILAFAERLKTAGFKTKDALHIACAVSAEAQYFVTTDDEILKRQSAVPQLILCDPTRAVRELGL
jgi:predicted nucleic acid-binding protein